jgi:hypothetical protein
VIVAAPASAGLTEAVAVKALPVYTNGPGPKVTEVVVERVMGSQAMIFTPRLPALSL